MGLAVADLLRDTLLDKRQAAAKVLLAPPPDLLRLSAFLPTLLTIKIPNRTLKKATKWAHEQMPPM